MARFEVATTYFSNTSLHQGIVIIWYRLEFLSLDKKNTYLKSKQRNAKMISCYLRPAGSHVVTHNPFRFSVPGLTLCWDVTFAQEKLCCEDTSCISCQISLFFNWNWIWVVRCPYCWYFVMSGMFNIGRSQLTWGSHFSTKKQWYICVYFSEGCTERELEPWSRSHWPPPWGGGFCPHWDGTRRDNSILFFEQNLRAWNLMKILKF